MSEAVCIAAGRPAWWTSRGRIPNDIIASVGTYILHGVTEEIRQCRNDIVITDNFVTLKKTQAAHQTQSAKRDLLARIILLRNGRPVPLDVAAEHFTSHELHLLLTRHTDQVKFIHSFPPFLVPV